MCTPYQVLASQEALGVVSISSLLSDWPAASHGNRLVAKASFSRIWVSIIHHCLAVFMVNNHFGWRDSC